MKFPNVIIISMLFFTSITEAQTTANKADHSDPGKVYLQAKKDFQAFEKNMVGLFKRQMCACTI